MARLFGDTNPKFKTGLAGTRGIYTTWQNMKQRCLNPRHPKYPRYGGRGVTICPEWLSILGFKAWAESSGWKENMIIDRIDNDGNYCPENCHWVSISESSRKKSTTKLTFEQAQIIRQRLEAGENAYDLADEYGVVHGTIWFIQHRFTHVPDGECIKALKANRERKAKKVS